MESRSFEAALGMVGAGIGVTFVPDTVVRKAIDNKEGRTYASIAEFRPARNILIACKKGRYLSRAASEFIYMAKNMFQAQQPAEGHNKGSGL